MVRNVAGSAKPEEPEESTEPFLPVELINKVLRDYPSACNISTKDLRRINPHFRARFPTPTNALLFLQSAPTGWTLGGILDHLDAIKGYPDAGFLMDQTVVNTAVEKAVDGNSNSLPLVLRALYPSDTAAPDVKFVRLPDKNYTCMAVQPLYDTLPEVMYIRFQNGTGPSKIGCRFNYTTNMEVMSRDVLLGLCSYARSASGRGLELGWAPDATKEQQKTLVSNLQTEAYRFCIPRSNSSELCVTLLLKALQLEKGDVPYNEPVHVRDACV